MLVCVDYIYMWSASRVWCNELFINLSLARFWLKSPNINCFFQIINIILFFNVLQQLTLNPQIGWHIQSCMCCDTLDPKICSCYVKTTLFGLPIVLKSNTSLKKSVTFGHHTPSYHYRSWRVINKTYMRGKLMQYKINCG